MNKAMFPALKFLSLDYAYENIMKQKLAISWMLIPFPKGILQDEDYIHNNIFLNDTYRRPWKISIPTCKVHDEDSITDVWKKYASIAEFLEKKGKPFDIVPSSNPCSQIDLEEVYSLTESYSAESMNTHEECWKTILSTDVEDFFLGEEIVFVNYLVQFGQHLPSLETLLSRLKTFSVQDPLIGLFRILSAKETLYRMNASIEENLEPNILLEEFHQLSPGAEESLSLPCTMELDEYAIDGRSSMSELTTVLQLAPEQMPEVEGLADTAAVISLVQNAFVTIQNVREPSI
ncbi:protein shortage in chiasmata 1 ortholog-like [Mixophyes fleayi]|uniref:protein shortage in chiasmata 1 ortholog-like n=1 Tax=Mixophyes fleayi TaxID=3061075 RepID=UPI003F4DEB95